MSTENAIDPLSQRPERDAGLPLRGNVCVECGGYVKNGRLRCAVCRREAHESEPVQRSCPAPIGSLQFSIETVLLVTTLVATCLSLVLAEPSLGIFATAVSMTALVRTLVIGRQHQRVRMPFPASEKIAEFGISLFIVFGAIGVGLVTLVVIGMVGWICAAMLWCIGPPETPVEQVGFFILGVIFWLSVLFGPLAAGIWFLWTTRPQG